MSLSMSTEMRTLKEQVAHDLAIHLEKFQSSSAGLRLLAQETQLNQKTLKRLLTKSHRPSNQTLVKLYSHLLEQRNLNKVIKHAPEIVAVELKRIQSHVSSVNHNDFSEVEKEIQSDRCFGEIFALAGCGSLTRDFIQFRFGQHGLEVLMKMQSMGAIKQLITGEYSLGENLGELSAQTLKQLGLHLSSKYANSMQAQTKGQNIIAFFAEGLSDEAYQRWLAIDEKAFEEKMQVVQGKGSLGKNRAFTFMVTDQLTEQSPS